MCTLCDRQSTKRNTQSQEPIAQWHLWRHPAQHLGFQTWDKSPGTVTPVQQPQGCCSTEWREHQDIVHPRICHFTVYDMARMLPKFYNLFSVKNDYGQNFTQGIFFNCHYFNIFTKCILWSIWRCFALFCFVFVKVQESTEQKRMNGPMKSKQSQNGWRMLTQLPTWQITPRRVPLRRLNY